MATSNDQYRQFHHALILAPGYMGLAGKDRKACSEFVELATNLHKKSPPDPKDVEAAYVAAVDEARKLVAKGLLTVELPNEERQDTDKTDTAASTTPASRQKYEIHPTAAIFPMMSDSALDELAADIKEHGLRDPIVMYQGKVIDGRNRLEGCHRAGVEPSFEEWSGTGSVVAWIASVNLHRRHLSDQQRAMLAARVAKDLSVEGKERRAQNLSKSSGAAENLDPDLTGEGSSAEKAAKLFNVSRDATNKATRIAKDGAQELMQAVADGTVSLDAAAQVASLPRAKQREVVAKGEVQEAAKQIRKEKAASKGKTKEAPEPQPDADEDEPQGKPPAPTDEVEPAADTEPPEAEPEEAEEDVDTDAPAPATPDEIQLLKEAHDGLDKMVAAARCAGRIEHASKQLRSLVAHCQKMTVQYEEIAMP